MGTSIVICMRYNSSESCVLWAKIWPVLSTFRLQNMRLYACYKIGIPMNLYLFTFLKNMIYLRMAPEGLVDLYSGNGDVYYWLNNQRTYIKGTIITSNFITSISESIGNQVIRHLTLFVSYLERLVLVPKIDNWSVYLCSL